MNVFTICAIYLLVRLIETRSVLDEYNEVRNSFIDEEKLLSLGGNLSLTLEEVEANQFLMQLKRKEIKTSFNELQQLDISKHYFTYKENIEQSKLFQIMQIMPKGAALHLHSTFMLDADSLLELTYEEPEHLYVCYNNVSLNYHFNNTVPTLPCPVQWSLLKDLREVSVNITDFDILIKKHFTLDNKVNSDANINEVWEKFENLHTVIKSLISYRPVREKYFYKVLERFYADNVMYFEFRTGLGHLYELNGWKHEKLHAARLFKNITNKFIENHPDFIGIKIIVTCYRGSTRERVREALNLAKALKEELPDIFAGFDLVGQEDLGKPLIEFVPLLRQYKDIRFLFHAGETLWFGSPTDKNLIDAIMMGSKRIGHAYSLLKHPILMKLVREKDIGLEVTVISNAVLSLVKDVRNHPLATYLALGMPVVLSSDDSTAWEAQPLSHDFYVAFVYVASMDYDLRMLKQLALNSIKYSALDDKGKDKCLTGFDEKWSEFIRELIKMKAEMSSPVDLGTTTIEPR